ncbi:hypothetical protein MM326_11105 [Alkalihalobacillus sp. LMS6]|uniref:hypothetical protein n=1 Tax=Alkalihalobacillus sp. LMS6 TaxID=2924034 RepID=UPI0020D09F24|nr:hypothetical protein [Alkalihalobacillus sp. LMS6]UTR04688.1 hypothetical protein MM326_11105 [Alkalihalobacillus sp. LMS6]
MKNQIALGYDIPFPNNISKQLDKFTTKIRQGKTCSKCNIFYFSRKIEHSHCPICGEHNLLKLYKGDEIKMIYSGIKVDVRGLAHRCPKCDNEEILSSFCHICGIYLINECSGFIEGEIINDPFSRQISWKDSNGCGTTLEGNARFCINCGKTSTFYEQELFSITWQEEREFDSEKLPF